MKLVISKTVDYDELFIEWLVEEIKFELMKLLDSRKLRNMIEYIDSNDAIRDKLGILNIDSVGSIITASIDEIVYTELKSAYIIQVNPAAKIIGVNIPLASLCRMVNYGFMDVKGYPLFTTVFNRVKSNLSRYYAIYFNRYFVV